MLGIAYKKNVDDMRESPSVVLMKKLQDLGAKVDYSDPHVPTFRNMRNFQFDLSSITLTEKTLAAYDCVLLATDHDRFDYPLIEQHASLIIDTRGRYLKHQDHIIRA